MPEAAFLDAVSLVRQQVTVTEVELVRAEWATGPFGQRVIREAVILHERGLQPPAAASGDEDFANPANEVCFARSVTPT